MMPFDLSCMMCPPRPSVESWILQGVCVGVCRLQRTPSHSSSIVSSAHSLSLQLPRVFGALPLTPAPSCLRRTPSHCSSLVSSAHSLSPQLPRVFGALPLTPAPSCLRRTPSHRSSLVSSAHSLSLQLHRVQSILRLFGRLAECRKSGWKLTTSIVSNAFRQTLDDSPSSVTSCPVS